MIWVTVVSKNTEYETEIHHGCFITGHIHIKGQFKRKKKKSFHWHVLVRSEILEETLIHPKLGEHSELHMYRAEDENIEGSMQRNLLHHHAILSCIPHAFPS